MRFAASPPVCYVRLYRLCSLVPSPVFTHIFAFSSVLLVLVSQSRHLPPSPCLFPAILLSAQPQHPIPSAHNPYIRSHWAVHSDEIGQLTTHLDEIGAEFVHFDHPITDFVRMNRTAMQRIRASDHQRDLFSGKTNV